MIRYLIITLIFCSSAFAEIIEIDPGVKIKIPENSSPNDLVQFLMSKGQLNHFAEVIPSANDIFIETVQKN